MTEVNTEVNREQNERNRSCTGNMNERNGFQVLQYQSATLADSRFGELCEVSTSGLCTIMTTTCHFMLYAADGPQVRNPDPGYGQQETRQQATNTNRCNDHCTPRLRWGLHDDYDYVGTGGSSWDTRFGLEGLKLTSRSVRSRRPHELEAARFVVLCNNAIRFVVQVVMFTAQG
jgi:hypothetical protein